MGTLHDGCKPVILYICDEKACGGECPNFYCNHTSNIEHAVNFKLSEDDRYYVEQGDIFVEGGEETYD